MRAKDMLPGMWTVQVTKVLNAVHHNIFFFFFLKYRPHPRSTESETLRVKPNNLVFCLFALN